MRLYKLVSIIATADLAKRKKKSPRKSKQMIEQINYYNVGQEESDVADTSLNWEGIGCASYFE